MAVMWKLFSLNAASKEAAFRLSKKYVIEEYLYPSYSPKEVGK